MSLRENRKLVANAVGPASHGKTDRVLQDALLRVNRAINWVGKDEEPAIQDSPGIK